MLPASSLRPGSDQKRFRPLTPCQALTEITRGNFPMPSLPVLVLNSGSSSIKFSVYEAQGLERRKLHEGAVDGIGTDQGEFWIKDAAGNKLVDQSPALPNPAVAFKLVADALHSSDFPA